MSNEFKMQNGSSRQIAKAASSGLLSPGDTKMAEELLKRLSTPVRLTIMGTDGMHRADIVNLIFGKALLPAHAFSGSIQFQHAETFLCKAFKEDGEERLIHNPDELNELANDRLVFTEISFPNDMLKRVSILSLSPPQQPQEFEPALNWIFSRTDLLVWYAEGWTEIEHEFWNMVPTKFKDHSYLCASKDSGVLDPNAAVKPVFRSKMTLDVEATRQVVAGGMSDAQLIRKSGAYDLITAIRKDINAAKRETEDRLALLMQQYPDAMAAAQADEETVLEPPAKKSPSEEQPAVTKKKASHQLTTYDPTGLISSLEELGGTLQPEANFQFKQVFRKAAEILMDAAEEISAYRDPCPLTQAFKQRCEAASDIVELVSVESDLENCPDGVAVLLQIKRDAQRLQAALSDAGHTQASSSAPQEQEIMNRIENSVSLGA